MPEIGLKMGVVETLARGNLTTAVPGYW